MKNIVIDGIAIDLSFNSFNAAMPKKRDTAEYARKALWPVPSSAIRQNIEPKNAAK
jgi:hypothetical protein